MDEAENQLDSALCKLIEAEQLQASQTTAVQALRILRQERQWKNLTIDAVKRAFHRMIHTSEMVDFEFIDVGGMHVPIFAPSASRSLVKDCVQFVSEKTPYPGEFGSFIGAQSDLKKLVVRVGDDVIVVDDSAVRFSRPSPFIVLDIEGVRPHLRSAVGKVALIVDKETAQMYLRTLKSPGQLASAAETLF